MCGIAGYLSARPRPEMEPVVHAVVNSQVRRGPDFQCVRSLTVARGAAVLGHDRLSIIDLSPEANQPIFDATGRFALVFNGELYNYIELREELRAQGVHFATQSDTEVLIEAFKAWGEDALPRFNGMFAFALVDTQQGRAWLVRDRFGVKPLYVGQREDGLAFASTGTALAQAFGLRPNLAYVWKGLTTWNFDDVGEECQYDGLQMLPPGTLLRIDLEPWSVTRHRWYDLAARAEAQRDDAAGWSDQQAAERVLATLESASALRLRADVPVAVALSGGLDSGTIAGLVGRDHKEVRAFCFGDPADRRTEAPVAQAIADQAGISIRFITPDRAREVAAWRQTLLAQDAPFVGGAQVAQYLVCQQVRAEGYPVLLGGQGGDEGYMGYRKYFMFALKHLLGRRKFGAAARFGASLVPMMLSERANWSNYWRHRARFRRGSADAPPPERALLRPDGWTAPALGVAAGQIPWQRQMLDITHYSLPTLLRYEDRNSMGNSVETRLPFLDYRMLELGLALPDRHKVGRGYGKLILRQIAGPFVPDEVRWAKFKMGFSIDQPGWIRAGLGTQLRAWLSEAQPGLSAYVRPGVDLNSYFSDERLIQDVGAMPELIACLWLGGRETPGNL